VHVGEGSSEEGYKKAEALVVSIWELEEIWDMGSSDSHAMSE
jgi:hypothetical protein